MQNINLKQNFVIYELLYQTFISYDSSHAESIENTQFDVSLLNQKMR